MATASKKTDKRGLNEQLTEVRKLQRRIARGGLLHVKSKGELLVDEFVKDYGKGDKRALREAVEWLGYSAVEGVTWSYDLRSEAREMGNRALQNIAKVDQSGQWLRNLDEAAMFKLYVGLAAREGHPAGLELDEIIDALKTIHRCHQALRQSYEVMPPLQSGRSEILASEFVGWCRRFHRDRIGRPAPKSRMGRFVDFMEAAWVDLDFPKLRPGTLGNLAERLPHSAPKHS